VSLQQRGRPGGQKIVFFVQRNRRMTPNLFLTMKNNRLLQNNKGYCVALWGSGALATLVFFIIIHHPVK